MPLSADMQQLRIKLPRQTPGPPLAQDPTRFSDALVLDLNAGDDINAVKTQLHKRLGVPIDRQRLWLGGDEITDPLYQIRRLQAGSSLALTLSWSVEVYGTISLLVLAIAGGLALALDYLFAGALTAAALGRARAAPEALPLAAGGAYVALLAAFHLQEFAWAWMCVSCGSRRFMIGGGCSWSC